MIGAVLLIIAIYHYIYGKRQISILLFLSFASNGFNILSNNIIGIKNLDLATIYTIIICIYSKFKETKNKKKYPDKKIKSCLRIIGIFLFCSFLYSIYYYKFTIVQTIQGGRHFLIIFCYYFLCRLNARNILWVVDKVYYITIVVSTLYVVQVLTRLPVLPYWYDATVNYSTGIARYYNYPFYISLYIIALGIYYNKIKLKFKTYAFFIFITALICTQARLHIAATVIFLIIGLISTKNYQKLLQIGIIVTICMLPTFGILKARFRGSEGSNRTEFTTLMSGDFEYFAMYGTVPQPTMIFRFAWIAERVMYLNERPYHENLFGLGIISDSQEIVTQKYDFKIGLYNFWTNKIAQLDTPDITYGYLLSRFGYLGGILIIILWYTMSKYLYKHRDLNPFIFACALYSIQMFLEGFSSNSLGEPGNVVMPYLMCALTNFLIIKNNIQIKS